MSNMVINTSSFKSVSVIIVQLYVILPLHFHDEWNPVTIGKTRTHLHPNSDLRIPRLYSPIITKESQKEKMMSCFILYIV